MIKKSDFLDLGGCCEEFACPGGGLVNSDLFRLIQREKEIQPVLLLGEATFHQVHGGIASNAALEEHPWQQFAEEYERIRGRPFAEFRRAPVYLGTVHRRCWPFLLPKEPD